MSASLVVVSRYLPEDIVYESDDASKEQKGDVEIRRVKMNHAADQFNDSLDDFNHPRYRRLCILDHLSKFQSSSDEVLSKQMEKIMFVKPDDKADDIMAYQHVHSKHLLEFLTTSWKRWDALGAEGQDPLATLGTHSNSNSNSNISNVNGNGNEETSEQPRTLPLIPGNVALPRDSSQRPSNNVMGQIGYYCTDTSTPIFAELLEELQWDVAVMEEGTKRLLSGNTKVVYALATHPGHHSAEQSFGGYCYLNHAAFCARRIQSQYNYKKVAILDIDYHCGNGTASIFYNDPTVLVVSIHCHPDHDYPFHSGFADEIGEGEAAGSTLHLPLLPGTQWESYNVALEKAMTTIRSFGAQALIVSMGLDTHQGDPCAIRRAGFALEGNDYTEMGQWIGSYANDIPILVIQEGGYRMDVVPKVAMDVLVACTQSKK